MRCLNLYRHKDASRLTCRSLPDFLTILRLIPKAALHRRARTWVNSTIHTMRKLEQGVNTFNLFIIRAVVHSSWLKPLPGLTPLDPLTISLRTETRRVPRTKIPRAAALP